MCLKAKLNIFGALCKNPRVPCEAKIKCSEHVAPVHWNHINLTGDYSWWQNKRVEKGDSGYSERHPRLSVLYFPFRQTTPSCKGGGEDGESIGSRGQQAPQPNERPKIHGSSV